MLFEEFGKITIQSFHFIFCSYFKGKAHKILEFILSKDLHQLLTVA